MNKLLFLKNPWVVLLSIALGAAIGLFNKDLALFIAPFSDIYLSFLKMCVLPIMVTAVVSSIGKLLLAKESGIFLKRMVVVFCIGLLVSSA
ncbi:hypothetical protein SD70_21780 [Gordoniibacillus kamchatkensis]|uniref:Dicarboxylate/amino acid:cation symporter n=1 Tax=Gordoniibacillus kamchatkensis TaxID=1590651 RepID=A0ABR5ADP6_9BACL|nr:cation:dicarboxylase symporter family transporter [Paenibacillus sp. VKM B-2647]KIL39174.1 hypothetical protein SD70_21780 [Paenibacillus sp. VKM B-2647]